MLSTVFTRLRSAALVLCGYRPANVRFDQNERSIACFAAEIIADRAQSSPARRAAALGNADAVYQDWDFLFQTAYAGIVLYATHGADELRRSRLERTERRERAAELARYLVWLERGGEEAVLITLTAADEGEARAVTEFLLGDGPDKWPLQSDPVTGTRIRLRIARVERLGSDPEPTAPSGLPF